MMLNSMYSTQARLTRAIAGMPKRYMYPFKTIAPFLPTSRLA
jgi:hypothetical protein